MTGADGMIPEGWGVDLLAAFIDQARDHLLGAFAQYPTEYGKLVALDASIYNLTAHTTDSENPCAAALAVRAASSYRAAVQLAMSGQIPEAYMVLRGCPESALYAHLIDENVDAWDVWNRRGESVAAQRACAKLFSKGVLVGSLAKRSPALSEQADQLYERCIELGAHPNEMAVAMSMEVETRADGGITTRHDAISGDTEAFHLALQSVSDIGVVVVNILNVTFPLKAASLLRLAAK
jgi:hypothetical protein